MTIDLNMVEKLYALANGPESPERDEARATVARIADQVVEEFLGSDFNKREADHTFGGSRYAKGDRIFNDLGGLYARAALEPGPSPEESDKIGVVLVNWHLKQK
jgi:hypothetical protein